MVERKIEWGVFRGNSVENEETMHASTCRLWWNRRGMAMGLSHGRRKLAVLLVGMGLARRAVAPRAGRWSMGDGRWSMEADEPWLLHNNCFYLYSFLSTEWWACDLLPLLDVVRQLTGASVCSALLCSTLSLSTPRISVQQP